MLSNNIVLLYVFSTTWYKPAGFSSTYSYVAQLYFFLSCRTWATDNIISINIIIITNWRVKYLSFYQQAWIENLLLTLIRTCVERIVGGTKVKIRQETSINKWTKTCFLSLCSAFHAARVLSLYYILIASTLHVTVCTILKSK